MKYLDIFNVKNFYFKAAAAGTQVARITANDVDTNPTLLYDFTPQGNPRQTFSIDRFSGRITLARPLNHEERSHFVLGLVVNDTKYQDVTQLDVYVQDENDNAPVFSQRSYEVRCQAELDSSFLILSVAYIFHALCIFQVASAFHYVVFS